MSIKEENEVPTQDLQQTEEDAKMIQQIEQDALNSYPESRLESRIYYDRIAPIN